MEAKAEVSGGVEQIKPGGGKMGRKGVGLEQISPRSLNGTNRNNGRTGPSQNGGGQTAISAGRDHRKTGKGLVEARIRTPVGRPGGGYSPYSRRKAWWRLGSEGLVEARIRSSVGKPGGGYSPYPRREAWWRLGSVPP
ncbi:hypothetical protein Bbelb_224360 [Branchiostoma belcheri]|nr:hypothetical protein Bbelb_224360 [Branchiostoma belcheri]